MVCAIEHTNTNAPSLYGVFYVLYTNCMYTWKCKPVRFNGCASPAPSGKELLFNSKDEFDTWYKGLVAGLAELDEAMNYCKYFVRTKGNEGNYVREGKSFPVHGTWVGIQDFDPNYKPTQPFVQWLTENGWRDTWFDLMDRYKQHIDAALYIKPITQHG